MTYARQVLRRNPDGLLARLVPGETAVPSFGGWADLDAHDAMLVAEFAGSPELLLAHALLIVRIRRQHDLANSLDAFFGLWDRWQRELCRGLSSRWLVSACDTFFDHGSDAASTAYALGGSFFMNTVKLYETERRVSGQTRPAEGPDGPYPLDDGMTAYLIGRGDMIFNLMRRLSSGRVPDLPAAGIFAELVRRAQAMDSVFHRFRAVHANEATRW